MKLSALLLATCAFFSTSVSATTDESLNARSEYYFQQAEKRRLARLAAEEEALRHIHVLDVNGLLKTIADDEDLIAEVVVIYKAGNKERHIAAVKEETAEVQTSTPVTTSSAKAKTDADPYWIEGRRFAGRNVWQIIPLGQNFNSADKKFIHDFVKAWAKVMNTDLA